MSKTTNKFSPEVRERDVRMFLDQQGDYGVKPICRVLQIAHPHAHVASHRDPERLSARTRRDIQLKLEVARGETLRPSSSQRLSG
ncbi:hypothetical protein [Asticcacaulis sp. W401b]|uniref:hypothetical protein n=1 Tax=Asticcacaulis sp. W401b TaxID=3388666 RepID=UPI0039708361